MADVSSLLPVDLNCDILYYQQLNDAKLPTVPDISFMQLYVYLGGQQGSMKAMDRSVKHVSAGDVTDVRVCQVRMLPVLLVNTVCGILRGSPEQRPRLTSRLMTLDDREICKFEFSEHFSGFRRFRMQQQLHE